jgi:hypothetical protein
METLVMDCAYGFIAYSKNMWDSLSCFMIRVEY